MNIKNLDSWAGMSSVSWIPVLKKNINLGSHYKVVPTEGYLAWEYNPLRNYRLSQNMYEKDGKYYTWDEFHKLTGTSVDAVDLPNEWTLKEEGELVDFITNELSFNLSHPVDILPQYSYDGSVNLILNDGLNIPRLINSRFTVTGRNTYKVIDRKGDNDTNIYDQGEQFDVDTSLFKNVNKIPKLEYLGTSSGNMKIGNYHFYFKYSDADGNESDWVAESGLVSVFIGNSPQSVNTGIRDENSIKSVRFRLSNIDIGYSYVKIYYTRYSADIDSNFIVQAKRIDKNFIINNSGVCMILITGDEDETEVTLEEINSSFDVIQNAQTQCSAANRLFMANVHKSRVEYDILSKLSLCFCPYKSEEPYPLINGGMNETYDINSSSDGYYDTQYIYDKTGYWPGELYRLGVVYILKDGSLSPVFNIRGATNITAFPGVEDKFRYKIYEDFYPKTGETTPISDILKSIEYSEEDYMIIGGTAPNENAKGVIQFSEDRYNETNEAYPFPVVGINITTHNSVIKELKKYIKGFFFVRQKRIPTVIGQGLSIGVDSTSYIPMLYNGKNYITESFLSKDVLLTTLYGQREITTDTKQSSGLLCLDACVSPVTQSMLDGSDYVLQKLQDRGNFETISERHFNINFANSSVSEDKYYTAQSIFVNSDVPAKIINDLGFSTRAGSEEDIKSFGFFGGKNYDKSSNKLVRGIYCPFIGTNKNLDDNSIYNIRIKGYNTSYLKEYFKVRGNDLSPFYAISDRYAVDEIPDSLDVYRGDCYTNTVTFRINRNFVDSSVPINDIIIDAKT